MDSIICRNMKVPCFFPFPCPFNGKVKARRTRSSECFLLTVEVSHYTIVSFITCRTQCSGFRKLCMPLFHGVFFGPDTSLPPLLPPLTSPPPPGKVNISVVRLASCMNLHPPTHEGRGDKELRRSSPKDVYPRTWTWTLPLSTTTTQRSRVSTDMSLSMHRHTPASNVVLSLLLCWHSLSLLSLSFSPLSLSSLSFSPLSLSLLSLFFSSLSFSPLSLSLLSLFLSSLSFSPLSLSLLSLFLSLSLCLFYLASRPKPVTPQ